MEMQRCPACGWPAPKGRPCPRGCGALGPTPPPPTYAAPTVTPAPAPTVVAAQEAPSPSAEVPVAPPPAAAYRRSARWQAGPKGIGGLLLLPVIGLVLTLCWNAWNIYHNFLPFRGSEAWVALTTPGSDVYHWLWQPLALFEVFASIVMVIAPIALLVAIFRKRRSAPRLIIAFYVFCCLAAAVDACATLLVMVHWLRSIGLTETAESMSSATVRSLYQVALLAAVWIPYFARSRRVRKTFTHSAPAAEKDATDFMAAADKRERGHGWFRTALAVVSIVVLAGAGVYAYDTYLPGSAAATAAETRSEPAGLLQQAEAAYAAKDWNRAIALYAQAIDADPGDETAYYGQWGALVEKDDLGNALQAAVRITERFPGSREAWFALGYTQELRGSFEDSATSYTRCLAIAQTAEAVATVTDDVVQERLALVSYVNAIARPRIAISQAVNQVSIAIQETTPDVASLSRAAAQTTAVLDANIAQLEKIAPPAYFSAFHTGMLAAYQSLESACDRLAGAASSDDPAALPLAEKGLNDAIDAFNQNDAIGTTLINDYYGQQPPIALVVPGAAGA